MTLSWPVVGAVLFAALLHASWNALVKSSQDKDLDMATIHLIGSFMAIPLVALVGWPKAEAWPFIAASVVIHIGYYLALTGAYRHGDLGLTYPLMRGVAPLLVALSATFTLGETLSPLAWAGVIGISCGVLVLGLNRHALEAPKAVAFALANAVIIAVYTVVDGLGVRASGNALQYVATLFLFDGWPFALLMFATRGPALGRYARTPLAAGHDWRLCLARLLRHRPVGHDARAGRHRGRFARDFGPVCRPAGGLVSERGTDAPKGVRCRHDRLGRHGVANGLV
jgi:phosphonate utilization associated putative membrane protein